MTTATAKAQYTKQSKTYSKDASLLDNVFVYGRLLGGVTVTQSQPLTYRALQRACKLAGVKASGSANDLRKALWMSEHGDKTPAPIPLTKRQKQAQNENDSHTQDTSQDESQDESHDTSFDYETAYAMDTSVTYEVPCEPVELPSPAPSPEAPRAKTVAKLSSIGLSYRDSQRFVSWWRDEDKLTMPCKNCGWDNVEANITHILNQLRFWSWASTEHGQAALAAMGVSI